MSRTPNGKQPVTYQVELIALAQLVPYVRNARQHSEEQIAQIVQSLREFGWTNPVLIDAENTIVAGHGRVRAAMRIKEAGSTLPGWEHGADRVPCIRLGHLTDAQRRAYTIADNKLALNATWDYDMLGTELSDLIQEFDPAIFGFNAQELDAIIHGWNGEPKPEQQPEQDENAAVLTVRMDATKKEAAREVVGTALDSAGIEHTIG